MKAKVVLYNPRAAYFTMPLALLAIGSAIDRRRFDVTIVDGRVEPDPVARVIAETEDAICLGVTVLTGAPIRDALAVTLAVRAARPGCTIVWGGWHPSLFAAQTVADAGIDAAVVGQGEDTFAAILDRLADGAGLDGVAGCVTRATAGSARPMKDLNALPAHDYSLVPVERYFSLKRQHQLDYITSQGCRFRCAFCADPSVYGRAWSGLDPARIGDELQHLWKRYGFTDVGFQDETFFTHAARVGEIAEQILRRSLRFSWMATMRADQGARLDEQTLLACRAAGLRRVMIGLESGSQAMLDWMKKDVRLDHVFLAAEKCRRHDIAVLFNLIVGFPDEPAESVAATLRVARELRAFGPDFQVAIFYYRPYPGSEIADGLARRGHPLPAGLEAWAAIDDAETSSPWVDREKRDLIEGFRFYQRIGWSRPTWWRAPVQAVARWRCRRDMYAFSIEKAVAEWVRPSTVS
jgi:radical SAM superfamily enzyme YgiQ (UPF0313 family)